MIYQISGKNSVIERLTIREKQIVTYLAEGLTSKEVAALLHLSLHTVLSHRKNANEKLCVKTGVQLGAMAQRLGLLTPRDSAPLEPHSGKHCTRENRLRQFN